MQKPKFVNEPPRFSAAIALFPTRFHAAAAALLSRGGELV